MEEINKDPGLNELALNELGTEEGEEGEDIIIDSSKANGRGWLFCKRCDSYRQEILYYENQELIIRCLSCGLISTLPLNSQLPKEKVRRHNLKKKSIGYIG